MFLMTSTPLENVVDVITDVAHMLRYVLSKSLLVETVGTVSESPS